MGLPIAEKSLRNVNLALKMNYKLFLSSFRKNRIDSFRHFWNASRQFKEASEIKDYSRDDPIQYSTSKAGEWKAAYSTSGESYFKTPRIQPLVVVMSLTAFMVYFCILREENDLDDWLRKLESNVPRQVEIAQLRAEIQDGRKRGIDVQWKEARLKEIQRQIEY